MVLAGLCVGTGALVVATVLPRSVWRPPPRRPTPVTVDDHDPGHGDRLNSDQVPRSPRPCIRRRSDDDPGLGGRWQTWLGPSGRPDPGQWLEDDLHHRPARPCSAAVELATGLTYNCIETFTDSEKTWAEWVDPWIASTPGAAFKSWVAADPTGHQLIDTQNLIPDNESRPNWTAKCAAGDYNGYATQFATAMVSAGFGYSVIRLGHEMNGTWETDSLGNNPTQWRLWAQCSRKR